MQNTEISEITAATTSTSTHRCYLLNKHNQLAGYVLELARSNIKVLSKNDGKVKAELALGTSHVREMPLEPRDTTDAPTEASNAYWYPLRLSSPQNHFRVIYLET